jgi:hypothetical protein
MKEAFGAGLLRNLGDTDSATQDLMERSALVIIDYDKAIENGFVELSQAMLKQAGKFKPKAGANDAQ